MYFAPRLSLLGALLYLLSLMRNTKCDIFSTFIFELPCSAYGELRIIERGWCNTEIGWAQHWKRMGTTLKEARLCSTEIAPLETWSIFLFLIPSSWDLIYFWFLTHPTHPKNFVTNFPSLHYLQLSYPPLMHEPTHILQPFIPHSLLRRLTSSYFFSYQLS